MLNDLWKNKKNIKLKNNKRNTIKIS